MFNLLLVESVSSSTGRAVHKIEEVSGRRDDVHVIAGIVPATLTILELTTTRFGKIRHRTKLRANQMTCIESSVEVVECLLCLLQCAESDKDVALDVRTVIRTHVQLRDLAMQLELLEDLFIKLFKVNALLAGLCFFGHSIEVRQ